MDARASGLRISFGYGKSQYITGSHPSNPVGFANQTGDEAMNGLQLRATQPPVRPQLCISHSEPTSAHKGLLSHLRLSQVSFHMAQVSHSQKEPPKSLLWMGSAPPKKPGKEDPRTTMVSTTDSFSGANGSCPSAVSPRPPDAQRCCGSCWTTQTRGAGRGGPRSS